jgi:hypothetical protein
MERYISEADILTNIKRHRATLDYDEQFDIDMEFKIIQLGNKGINRFKKNDRYATYLGKRYDRHKLKTDEHSNT